MKPQLRFKEFTDDWEEKKLGEVAEIIIGMTYSPENLCNEKEGTLVLRSSNIKDNLLIFNDNKYIKNINIPEKKYINDDDILLCSRNGSRELIGKSVLCKNICEKMTFGAFMTLIRGKFNHYIAYEIQTNNLKKYIHKNLGATINQITTSDLKKYKFFIPSLPEQEKIGKFFSLLDQRIEKQERKVALLEERKKGWMQKLFNQEIRFKGNYPDWEEKKLGDIFQERNEKSSIGELLSVSILKGVTKFNDSERRNNSNIECGNYKKVYVNDIAYNSMRMWQGALGVSNYVGIVSPAYTVITPRDYQDSVFWSYAFKIQRSLYQFKKYSQGLTSDTWNLKYPLLSQIKFFVPSLPEQEKIANFLSAQDELIEKEKEKLNLMKQEKQGFMQRMFI